MADSDYSSSLRAGSAAAGHGLYLGLGTDGPAFASPQHSVLVLGPPRSGKTSGVVVPNVLAACGPVVSTSTKPDVLLLTSPSRSRVGECYLFDPSGSVSCPEGVRRIGWSPLISSATFEGAALVADAMVTAARPGALHGESAHWNERAAALLSVFFHAGAVGGLSLSDVVRFVDTREPDEVRSLLARHGAERPSEVLSGIVRSDSREQSGIWSTASSVLSCYRSEAALKSAEGMMLDPAGFVGSTDTLYICAAGDQQRLVAPVMTALLRDLKAASYSRASESSPLGFEKSVPLVLALDEVANIAPLSELPSVVAEGGSQGVLVLACFQDLSQAQSRWPEHAKGFFTTFGTKLVFPGVADTDALERISKLLGEMDVPVRSTSRATGLQALLSRRSPVTRTTSSRRERCVPVSAIWHGWEGSALLVEGVQPYLVRVPPVPLSVSSRPDLGTERAQRGPGDMGRARLTDLDRDPSSGRERGGGLARG